VVQLQIVDCRPSLDIRNLIGTRADVGCRHVQVSVVGIFCHGVSRSDRLEVRRGDDIRYRTDSRALDYTGQDLLESGYITGTSKSGAVGLGVITEKRLNPVVDIVRYFELKVLVENGTMSNTVECFRKVQSINNDVRICVEESGDGVEELY